MKFQRYHSIENSYRKKFLDKIVEEGHYGEIYVVQEKVHGGNFSFWMDENKTECAKRSGFIKEDEKFFNFQDVKKRYYKKMRQLFLELSAQYAENVVVCGELYGGNYPHPDVPKFNNCAVQKGVYYNPQQDFIAFDLKIDGKYLPVDEANDWFDTVGIPYAKTLFKGSLEKCLEYPNEFQTTIPTDLNLPDIKDNTCEGVVIRPVEPIFLWSGERLIIKNKNTKFTEKHGSMPKKPRKEVKQVSPEVKQAIELTGQYINENRLKNVLSKIGEVTQKDFGKIMGLFTQDVIEDFMKDEDEFFQSLEKKDRKLVTQNVGKNAALLLRKNFVNIVDGEF